MWLLAWHQALQLSSPPVGVLFVFQIFSGSELFGVVSVLICSCEPLQSQPLLRSCQAPRVLMSTPQTFPNRELGDILADVHLFASLRISLHILAVLLGNVKFDSELTNGGELLGVGITKRITGLAQSESWYALPPQNLRLSLHGSRLLESSYVFVVGLRVTESAD